jgi:hypothetical protein
MNVELANTNHFPIQQSCGENIFPNVDMWMNCELPGLTLWIACLSRSTRRYESNPQLSYDQLHGNLEGDRYFEERGHRDVFSPALDRLPVLTKFDWKIIARHVVYR